MPENERIASAEKLGEEAPEQREADVYRIYLNNIRSAEQLLDELLIGAKQGEDLAVLLLKATKALSLMTGDRNFQDQMTLYVESVYGEGLGMQGPLGMKTENIRERIARLEEAAEQTDEPEVRNAIQLSIRAHKNRLVRLEARKNPD